MTPTTPLLKAVDAEPISGYRLIERLGQGGFGEVWKCEAPGGLFKAIKFVPGPEDELDTRRYAADELNAVQRIKMLRHPFLLTMERVEQINGELLIVMELADKSLQDVLGECREAGRPGIDRAELLGYLRDAADVLDLMRVRHKLQHLDIKPANLFLVCDHVKVGDFGLVQTMSERTGNTPVSPLGAVTPRYAAPELFKGRVNPSCDQYSLAIVYQELLTGTLPFDGRNFRRLMMQHSEGKPNLSALPEADRGPVARALSKDPAERFPSCRELIDALSRAGAGVLPANGSQSEIRGDDAAAKTQEPTAAAALCLPDLHFVGYLGRTPTGESWSARGADGQAWVVNLLYGVTGKQPAAEEEAVRRLQALEHPGLPARRVGAAVQDFVAVATELCEMNLKAHFHVCRAKGGNGVPRRQLLDILLPVARTLDELFDQHKLPHLGLHPRNIMLEGDRVLIGDFGLLPLLFQPAGQLVSQLPARYAAPEVFAGTVGRPADVFSLAVIYQEILTGTCPFLSGASAQPPLLDALPAADQRIVARALHSDPARRFRTCSAFVEALSGPADESSRSRDTIHLPVGSSEIVLVSADANMRLRLSDLLRDAMVACRGPVPPVWVTAPDGTTFLEGRVPAALPPTGVLGKFDGFMEQWHAALVYSDDGQAVYQITQTGRGIWQRLRGAKLCLRVELSWARPHVTGAALPEIVVRIRAAVPDRAARLLLNHIGGAIVDSLWKQLNGPHQRRASERIVWPRPVQATFLLADGQLRDTIECKGKDLSLTGMGLYLPCALAGADVRLNLTPEDSSNPVVVTAQFVRVQRCGTGWYEAGVLFY